MDMDIFPEKNKTIEEEEILIVIVIGLDKYIQKKKYCCVQTNQIIGQLKIS